MRARKFIGLILLLMLVAVYALLVMGLAVRVLPGAHWAVELLFYAVAGLAWVYPAGLLIQWMSKPTAKQ